MATPGKPLEEHVRAFILRRQREYSIRKLARMAGVSRNTVRKYLRYFPAAGVPK